MPGEQVMPEAPGDCIPLSPVYVEGLRAMIICPVYPPEPSPAWIRASHLGWRLRKARRKTTVLDSLQVDGEMIQPEGFALNIRTCA